MKPRLRLSTLTMLVLLALLLVPLHPSTAVHAGDDAHAPAPAPAPAPRDAKRGHAELEHRLQVALVRADLNETRAKQLLRFVEDLLVRLAEASKPDESAQCALREHIDRLQAEIARLQDALRREQERFVKTIEDLRKEAAAARATSAPLEAQLLQAKHAQDVAEEQLRYRTHEVERLRWVYANSAPRESVSRILSNIPVAHWRAELLAGGATRARVALQVLGQMGSAASGALPWLEEVAEGEGRKAGQARRAIEKIRGP